MKPRHFLTLLDLSPAELKQVIERAVELKALRKQEAAEETLPGKVLGMIFEKSSTRTRVSFEAGMSQLGGSALFLSSNDTQLGRGEPIADSAKVLSRMVDIVMIRTFDHETVETFAENSTVPVINALTDSYHPCQLLADMQTFWEHRGDISGKTVSWIGDGNNMCQSYINAARQFDFKLNIACPEGYEPDQELMQANKDRIELFRDPQQAVKGCDLVVTDTWASMGQEEEKLAREKAFSGYQVNEELMSMANSDALMMHCLPAYRGLEVSETILDLKDSVVWDEAENRLHAQKALMEFLLAQR
ncbi:ornithine carbamoyltransferase [Pseudoteredinibacter isoporae]|uniref:Ornithine carbamoyltransferase n=1 Tax=Pseudoteredinibacter isoporae TaxID=570281 RepID=A0A7X0JWH1_9GAMM|nr:ornithine carbamoyltransferase [Pseudoteredinibacter isoporae]MBB6523527.1 ornithine carbamoyltransferase [Pseudoteredinibacter isoporae]NHO89036.1 ornithine carbamoyltransferase [Pseudoteredinibacter isoporae]NIB22353.1 ornithine carbamoyltransferase [Pseudoteredinibacter isoporae]